MWEVLILMHWANPTPKLILVVIQGKQLFIIHMSDNLTRFCSVVTLPDLDGKVSGSCPGHTNDFKNGTYGSLACACHNELE